LTLATAAFGSLLTLATAAFGSLSTLATAAFGSLLTLATAAFGSLSTLATAAFGSLSTLAVAKNRAASVQEHRRAHDFGDLGAVLRGVVEAADVHALLADSRHFHRHGGVAAADDRDHLSGLAAAQEVSSK
jgi:hypothetical protein